MASLQSCMVRDKGRAERERKMSKRSRDELETMKMVAGVMLAVVTAIVNAVREIGGTFEHVHRLTKPEGAETVRAIAALIVNGGKTATKTLGDTYRVTVDYTKSLAEMIAAGKYDYVNPYINEKNFPIKRPKSVAQTGHKEVHSGNGPYRTPEPTAGNIVELVLIHQMSKMVSTEDILKYLDKNDLRPATLAELLAFGAENPEIQRRFLIVALSSSWLCSLGRHCVPYLWGGSDDRDLGLYWSEWGGCCRFLAVSKHRP